MDGIDWSPWEAEYKRSGLGQPAIHPRCIAAAILYGLYRGIRSSRRLEEACCYRFDFMWLVENRRIDHTTFAKFRTKFHAPLKDLFRQIGRTAMNLGLIRLCEVAFDGMRVKANNSRYKTRTAKTLEEKLRALDKLFEELTAKVAAADTAEEGLGSPTRMPQELANVEQRRKQIQAALAKAKAADEARRKQGVNPEKNPAQVPIRCQTLRDRRSEECPQAGDSYLQYDPPARNSGWSKKLPGEPAWGVFFQCIEHRSRISPRVQEASRLRATDHEQQMKPLARCNLERRHTSGSPRHPRRKLIRGFSWTGTPTFL